MQNHDPGATIRLRGPETAMALDPQVWPCYRDVFGNFDDISSWRRDLFDRHAAREGYRLAVATDGPAVAGFSWGYVGQRGQYWPEPGVQVMGLEL